MARSLPASAESNDGEPQPDPPVRGPCLIFGMTGQWCGLPVEEIREVLPMCELLRPPALPPVLEGFLNLRGEVTPVVRIERLFGLAAAPFELHTHLIVLRRRYAIVADRARDIVAPQAGDVRHPPAKSVFGDCLEGVLRVDPDDISILRIGRLLLKQEEARIAEFRQIAERRVDELAEPAC